MAIDIFAVEIGAKIVDNFLNSVSVCCLPKSFDAGC